MGQQIVAAHDGGHLLFQQSGKVLLQAFRKIVVAACQTVIVRQIVLAQCMEKGAVTLLIDIGTKPAAEIADPPVSQLFQMGHSQIHALAVVHAHIAGGGVAAHIVVQQNRGGVAGLHLVQPGIGQRKTQKKGPHIVVLQHVFIVGDAFLYLVVQRYHAYHKAGGLGQLAEAGHNVVTEVRGLLAGHVFDEKAQLLCAFFSHGAGIPQFHCGFQHGFSQCFAHVGGAVQRLGNGALGDVQFVGNVFNSGHGCPRFSENRKK